MSARSARVAVPEGAHPYWRELLARCGIDAEALGSALDDPTAALLPDAAGLSSPAALREVQRLRGRGVPVVAGAAWGAKLLGGRTRTITAVGLGGVGHLSRSAASVRMPVRVGVLERATEGRLWPSRARAVAWSFDGSPLCVLPLAEAGLLLEPRSELTAFACGEDQVVSELVSAVDHGALRRLVLDVLRAACHAAARPLVRKAHAPAGYRGAFAFRVDADGFRPEATAATLEALARGRVRATWFIDVEHHLGGAQPVLAALPAAGHEVGSHFFHHYTYRSGTRNRHNLARSLAQLRSLGIDTNAAAAPFGAWNEGLQSAVRACGMRWSSEFSRLYDDVPCELAGAAQDPHEPWQVPVHPICPGLLLQKGLGAPAVATYFESRLRECLDRGEPAVFYGHPIGELERLPALFADLDKALASRAEPAWRVTLGELAEFELARRAQPVECRIEERSVVGMAHGPAGLCVESARGDMTVAAGSFALGVEPAGHAPAARAAQDTASGSTDPGSTDPGSGAWLQSARRAARWRGRRIVLARLAREARR